MQKELKRNNSIGLSECIDHFFVLIFDKKIEGIDTLHQAFRYNSLAQFNCYLAILFLKEINLIAVFEKTIALTSDGIEISKLPLELRKNKISEIVLNFLVQDKLIYYENIVLDQTTGELKIPANAFSLSAAIYRNFLYENGCFSKKDSYFVFNDNKLRSKLEKEIINEKKRLSQEELILQLQKQQEDGEKGELFVIEYERKRLSNTGLLPKQISVINVSAGYDILSCHNCGSKVYDRYIEVKSYRGKPHFYWSANEKRVAEVLGENYFLYLVDLTAAEQYGTQYIPHIINNPATMLRTDDWLIEPDSYRITYLK